MVNKGYEVLQFYHITIPSQITMITKLMVGRVQ